jgi:hypothetical protein
MYHTFKKYRKQQKKLGKKNFWLTSLRSLRKAGSRSESGSGSISQRYGFADPDAFQNVMDPQH